MDDKTPRTVAAYCDECEEHVAGEIIGRVVKCTQCGSFTDDFRT